MKKLICLLATLGFVTSTALADQVTLKIEGMTCPAGCVSKVKTALSKVKGVTASQVEVGSAQVTYDAAKTKKEDLVAAVEKAGFTVTK
ncbi:MAG TPA: heavy-metal-associated domain-containing protein [Methylomirabilota bacterium]|nr:heavy-metal-associated domain-containing protein [Methylomirabilota bacterium]